MIDLQKQRTAQAIVGKMRDMGADVNLLKSCCVSSVIVRYGKSATMGMGQTLYEALHDLTFIAEVNND